MNKRILIIILASCFFVGMYAQNPNVASPIFPALGVFGSALSESTAGTMQKDADTITNGNIFDVEQSFFSAGVQKDIVNGAWAMPVDKLNMTFGLAGNYVMDSTRIDTTGVDGTINSVTLPHGSIFTKTGSTEKSDFALRTVVRWTDFSFSYAIKRNGTNTTTIEKGLTVDNNTELMSHEVDSVGSYWQHELGYGQRVSDFLLLTVPLGVVLESSKTHTITRDATNAPDITTNTTVDDYTGTGANNGSDAITIYTSPAVEFSAVSGPFAFLSEAIAPLTKFSTGFLFSVEVYNPENKKLTTTTKSGNTIVGSAEKERVEETFYTEQMDLSAGIYLQPTFEWSSWENKISFIVEPRVQVGYRRQDDGIKTTATTITTKDGNVSSTSNIDHTGSTNNYINPLLGTNVGVAVSPNDFFELRAGLAYTFDWKINPHSARTENGSSDSRYDYKTESSYSAMLGCGFSFGENLYFDLNMDFASDSNIFDLDNFTTIQMTYRF